MKKLLIVLVVALTICGCGKKKEVDPELHKQAMEIAEYKFSKYKKENLERFLNGTNKNENVSLSMKDSILTVKIISKPDVDYSEFVEFYHDLARRSDVFFTGTELRDSLTGKVLARTGYGFKTPFNE